MSSAVRPVTTATFEDTQVHITYESISTLAVDALWKVVLNSIYTDWDPVACVSLSRHLFPYPTLY